MAYQTRGGFDWNSRSTLAITLWGATRFVQGDGMAEDCEFLRELKTDHLAAPAVNWDDSDAKHDGGAIVWSVDGELKDTTCILINSAGLADTNLEVGLEYREVLILGTVKFTPHSSIMPGGADDDDLTTHQESTTLNIQGAAWNDHVHKYVEIAATHYADWPIAGVLYTSAGEVGYTGAHSAKWIVEDPSGGGDDLGIWIYLDSDDGNLKIRTDASHDMGWCLCFIISPQYDHA